MERENQCRLCQKYFSEKEMSEEHYPAKSVGNDDIVGFDIIKMVDSFQSGAALEDVLKGIAQGKTFEEASGEFFDKELSKPFYPRGRTVRSLCRECNSFLGEYDKSYLKFFIADGEPKRIKGFQRTTRLNIIKAIFGKFLSVPETKKEAFDFIDFLRNQDCDTYNGIWHLYFVHRDYSSDIMGLADIQTGRLELDEGVVYEMSDDKFIFNLMNFEKDTNYKMNDAFDLLDDHYKLVTGLGKDGGYHAQIILCRLFQTSLGKK